MFLTIRNANRIEPIIQPTSATPTRSIPVQNNQMQRPASHHAMSIDVMKAPRPERKGSVYSDATVHHMPAASSSAGISSAINASARPAAGPWPDAMVIDDCQAASQRIGASKVSTAPCQSAGNNCANDSNMSDLGEEMCRLRLSKFDELRLSW